MGHDETSYHILLELPLHLSQLNLSFWSRYGDTEAIEDFLAIGKDVNAADEQGRTALHYAVAYQQQQVKRFSLHPQPAEYLNIESWGLDMSISASLAVDCRSRGL